MWRWLSATAPLNLLASLSLVASALAAPTSLGPTSAKEAEILWQDGQKAFEAHHYQDAINSFQRLVDRYPGYPGYLKAQEMLGIACTETGDPKRALPYLRNYVEAIRDPIEIARGKLALGDAYLALHRYHEAFLVSDSFEKGGTGPYSLKKALQNEPVLRAEGLMLRSRALIGMNHDERAQSSLESAEQDLRGHETPPLNGRVLDLTLTLKNRECGRLPSSGPLDEAQAREQLIRRASCLHDSLVTYRKDLARVDEDSAKSATASMSQAFSNFARACKEPPSPPPVKPVDRSAAQLKEYKLELAQALSSDCRQAFETATQVLKGPEGEPKNAHASQLAAQLEKMGHENFPR